MDTQEAHTHKKSSDCLCFCVKERQKCMHFIRILSHKLCNNWHVLNRYSSTQGLLAMSMTKHIYDAVHTNVFCVLFVCACNKTECTMLPNVYPLSVCGIPGGVK